LEHHLAVGGVGGRARRCGDGHENNRGRGAGQGARLLAWHYSPLEFFCLSMIFSENRFPLFGIML
jgi:hypothetical protein